MSQTVSGLLEASEAESPVALQRRTRCLLQVEFLRKQWLWAMDLLEQSPIAPRHPSDGGVSPGELYALAWSILQFANRAILARAKIDLRARLYPFSRLGLVSRGLQKLRPLS